MIPWRMGDVVCTIKEIWVYRLDDKAKYMDAVQVAEVRIVSVGKTHVAAIQTIRSRDYGREKQEIEFIPFALLVDSVDAAVKWGLKLRAAGQQVAGFDGPYYPFPNPGDHLAEIAGDMDSPESRVKIPKGLIDVKG